MPNVIASQFDVLVIEDNADLNSLLVQALHNAGYSARGVHSVEAFHSLALDRQPDLFVLDLNLPGEDGISFAQKLRAARPSVGIVMLTARDAADDRQRGYATGTDIYLTKPSSTAELLGAVGALARRIGTAAPVEVPEGGVTVTLHLRRLEVSGPRGRSRLTAEEADILALAASTPDGRMTNDEIRAALNRSDDLTKSAIEIKIVRLRKKLTEAGIEDRAIVSVRNVGYQLMMPCTVEG